MAKRQPLPERQDIFPFHYPPAEVNFGGKTRFYQTAFPPDWERLVFNLIDQFAEILLENRNAPARLELGDWQQDHNQIAADERAPNAPLAFNGWQGELLDIFMDQWCDLGRLDLERCRRWVNQALIPVGVAYRRLRLNALEQEKTAGIAGLGYLALLGASLLCADMISEYFEQQVELLGKMAVTARLTLGRCLALCWRHVEWDGVLAQTRQVCLGHPEPEPAVLRLLNPFSLAFNDPGDAGMIEEQLAGPNPYQLSFVVRSQLHRLVVSALGRSRRFASSPGARFAGEPAAWQQLLASRPDRRRLLRLLRRQPDLRVRLVTENIHAQVRQALRAWLRAHPEQTELYPFVVNKRQQEETLIRPGVRRRLQKILRAVNEPATEDLLALLRWGADAIKRSRRQWFGRLTRPELEAELAATAGRFGELQGLVDDFSLLRARYGRVAGQAIPWQGLRVWRTQELKPGAAANRGGTRIELADCHKQRQAEIENQFYGGNLFYLRTPGEIYPSASRRGERVIFMFADLRNSTETTMRLTKDTASFLTPYLTTVNQTALSCRGERIYFAGDGYAAYYRQALDGIRAAYQISGQFAKLRRQASEAHTREAREIYQSAVARGISLQDADKVREALKRAAPGELPNNVRELFEELARVSSRLIGEDDLKKALSKVAAALVMPRVDIGIAITAGELFFALVDEGQTEKNGKIKIVISPQLSQAARLSGSSEDVKNYIETHYPQPFPYYVHAWEKKLFNRGIVITEKVLEMMKSETTIQPFISAEDIFKQEKLLAYNDNILKKKIIIRHINEMVMLKGISEPCRIYEIATNGSILDKHYGAI